MPDGDNWNEILIGEVLPAEMHHKLEIWRFDYSVSDLMRLPNATCLEPSSGMSTFAR